MTRGCLVQSITVHILDLLAVDHRRPQRRSPPGYLGSEIGPGCFQGGRGPHSDIQLGPQ